jgi:carboxyl-terminal processing protease
MRNFLVPGLLAATLAAGVPARADRPGATINKFELDRARGMLRLAQQRVIEEYYDPAKVGLNFQQRCDQAYQQLAGARSNGEALTIIAQVFLDLGDSHTNFLPPARQDRVNHHWTMLAVGREVYVKHIDPGSDAEKQGLRIGDKVLAVDGIPVDQGSLHLLEYLIYTLIPRAGLRVLVQSPGAEPRALAIPGEIKAGSLVRSLTREQDFYKLIDESEAEETRQRSAFVELPDGVLVWRLHRFTEKTVAAGLKRLGTAKTLVLDLRGNPGGAVDSLGDLLSALFRDDFVVYTRQERAKTEPFRLRGRGIFTGPLFVLADRASASSSEITAYAVMHRGRGVLLGDHTAGAVATSRRHGLSLGSADKFVFFGVAVTINRIVMFDGAELEGRGVAPNYLLLPSPADLHAGRDPVLAKALSLAGKTISPEEAGRLFVRKNH